jgi:hypothetical protein
MTRAASEIGVVARIANHTDEQWYAMIDVHATAHFACCAPPAGTSDGWRKRADAVTRGKW